MGSTDEEQVLLFLQKIIKGTEWENLILLVGGAVRDQIMGKKPKDLDFVVNGELNSGIDFSTWLAKKLGNYKEESNPVIYPRFGTAKLSLNNNNSNLPNVELEFVAPRRETYTQGSRKPDVVNGDLTDETMRRDLTMNSLMRNISSGELIDISGKGVNDIKNGIIRTTSDPDIIFREDSLRMLRVVRFSVKYNFKIMPNVLKSMKKNAPEINTISMERINDELNKILLTSDPSRGIRLLQTTGLLKHIIEELDETVGMEQNIHHTDDVFNHTLSVLNNTPPTLKARLIALFHDIGKISTKTITDDGSVHFYGHEDESEKIVRKIMTRLKYSNDMIDAVALGVKSHMLLKHGGDDASKISDKSLRKFTAAVGDNLEDILDVIHADNISHADDSTMKNQINIVKDRIKKLNDNVTNKTMKLPINGDDLINMGLKQSPIFREILNAVQDAWYENPNISRNDALEIVKKVLIDKNITEIKRIMYIL